MLESGPQRGEERAERESAPAVSSWEGGLGTILVVEDDEDFRELLADHLLASGRVVRCAGNGAEALSALGEADCGIALVLLDLRMPVMDGFELARRLAAWPEPRIPIVIMTAEHETRRVERLPGVVSVLYKPLDVARLEALIEDHLRV